MIVKKLFNHSLRLGEETVRWGLVHISPLMTIYHVISANK